jgi:hypothetical protein
MRRISIEGVLVGGIVDLVISYCLTIAMTLSYYGLLNQTHMSTGRFGSVWLYAGHLAIGLCCSILGGYVAARIARHDELLNGAASAFLRIALGLIPIALLFFGTRGFVIGLDPLAARILPLLASPLFGLLGGYLRLRQTHRVQLA